MEQVGSQEPDKRASMDLGQVLQQALEEDREMDVLHAVHSLLRKSPLARHQLKLCLRDLARVARTRRYCVYTVLDGYAMELRALKMAEEAWLWIILHECLHWRNGDLHTLLPGTNSGLPGVYYDPTGLHFLYNVAADAVIERELFQLLGKRAASLLPSKRPEGAFTFQAYHPLIALLHPPALLLGRKLRPGWDKKVFQIMDMGVGGTQSIVLRYCSGEEKVTCFFSNRVRKLLAEKFTALYHLTHEFGAGKVTIYKALLSIYEEVGLPDYMVLDPSGCTGGTWWGVGEYVREERIRPRQMPSGSFTALLQALRSALTLDIEQKRRAKVLRSQPTPIPGVSRRDALFLAVGALPTLYQNNLYLRDTREEAAYVYVDVSGSFSEQLNWVLPLLTHLADLIQDPLFTFSTFVGRLKLGELPYGVYRTSYGTCFDAVADHILSHRPQRALIISDGVGEVSPQKSRAVRQVCRCFLVLTKSAYAEGAGKLGSLLTPRPEKGRNFWKVEAA